MAKGSEIWVCPQCGFRMDIAPLGLYAEVQCPRCFRSERVHAQLGNFRLDAVLGVGGMSVVYRAFDVVLHRSLALKVLNDTFRDQPERIERFENESAMMARVRHENVTSVYSAGRAYGQFYIAMELVEGRNLEYMVTAEQPMGAHQALDIICQVARGLQAANEAGLLHRDMKPGNILITPEGQAKVIDFGLAMDSREDDTEEIIWATPYYVPPETLQRKPEDVRTDIYALGMTLRFLLTGVERFEVEANSLPALVQCKRKLLPLSKQPSDIPPALCELVDHMTEFSPSDRPADYGELLAEIAEVQQELSAYKGAVSAAGVRHRRLVRASCIAAGLVVGALLGSLLASTVFPQQRALIPLPASAKQEARKGNIMPAVLDMIKVGKYGEAVDALLKAAEVETDPCLGAWYAQLARTILSSSHNDSTAAEQAHKLLLRHLANSSRVMPAGRRSFEALSGMDSRRYPGAREWAGGNSEWSSLTSADLTQGIEALEKSDAHPVIKILNWYVLSEKACWLGDEKLSERCLSHIRETGSLGRYEVVAKMLSAPSTHRRLSGPPSSGKTGKPTASERFAAVYANGGSKKYTSEQLSVRNEVVNMAVAMLSALERKKASSFQWTMSDDEFVRLARGLSPASRPAVWADGAEEGHIARDAIDGDLNTRWCAPNADGGHSFAVDIDSPEAVESIVLYWENRQTLRTRVQVYAEGKVYVHEFDKTKMQTRIDVGNKVIDRIELVFPYGGGNSNWAGLVELQLVTRDGRTMSPDAQTGRNDFADELRAVLLMATAQYDEAFAQMDFVAARQGRNSPFSVIAADWKRRWNAPSSAPPAAGASSGDKAKMNLAHVSNSDKFDNESIIRICRDCVMVRVLPGQEIRYHNRRGVPSGPGNMIFCASSLARSLKQKGVVEVLPDEVVPVVGLRGARYNTYTIVTGEIQPCRKKDAQHFQEIGAGKIVLSVDDLWDVRDKLNTDPFPIMLRREIIML